MGREVRTDVTEILRQSGWFLGRFAIWVVASLVVFEFLGVLTPMLLFTAGLVGFFLVAEYSEPDLSQTKLRYVVWVVSIAGFAVFTLWAFQWAATELNTLLAQTP
jgi:small-conductance mechanosensitive channel